MYNDAQATFFSPPGRMVVIGDVHGDVQRFMQCLYATRVFNTNLEWIAEPADTIIVQLGDQIDSATRVEGKHWEQLCDVEMLYLADRLDRIARLKGGRVLSLIGNHELMNIHGEFSYVSAHSADKLPLPRRSQLFRPGGSVAKLLAKRNLVLQIGKSVFCHAGILPHHLIMVNGQLHKINEIARSYMKGNPLTPNEASILNTVAFDMQGLLWTRMYIELSQANPEVFASAINETLGTLSCNRIFVGHNTVNAITSILDDKVFLVDAGLSRAYATQAIQILQIWHPDTEKERIETITIQTA